MWRRLCVSISALSLGIATATLAFADRGEMRGRALFVGSENLAGRIRDHRQPLPPAVLRCANCHASRASRESGTIAAPRLDRRWLLEARARRGGPPSVYALDTFCGALRNGVDPAFVMLAIEMPLYELDDAQCASVWAYLIAVPERPDAPR